MLQLQLQVKRCTDTHKLPPNVDTVIIWEEDDAPVPDKEQFSSAWERITGHKLSKSTRTGYVDDHGDWIAYLHRGGWVEIDSCEGSFIGILVEASLHSV